MTEPVVAWVRQQTAFNTSVNDLNPAIAVDSARNVYVAYRTTGTVSGGTSSGGNDIVVFKLDTSGTVLWVKQQNIFNTSSTDVFPVIAVDSVGNVYVSYQTDGTVSGGTNTGSSNDIVVFKLDTNGSVVWVKQQTSMNTLGGDNEPAIAVDSAGNVYVSYHTYGLLTGGYLALRDIIVFKLNSSGALLWAKQQARTNTVSDDLSSVIAVDSVGNVYVSYTTDGTVSGGTFAGTVDVVVFKLDTNGNVLWVKQHATLNTSLSDSGSAIALDSAGNVYVSYFTNGTVSGGTSFAGTNDIVVSKMDTNNGNVLWIRQQTTMNTSGSDTMPSIAVSSAGSVYVSYQTNGTVSGGTSAGSTDIVVFKLDTNGSVVWVKQQTTINTTTTDYNSAIAVDSAGNVYALYNTSGTASGGTLAGSNDIVVFKMIEPSPNTSATGSITISGNLRANAVLTSTNNIADANGLGTFSYAWSSSATSNGVYSNIAGATASSYTLTTNDIGKYIKLTISYTDQSGYAETITSATQGPVMAGTPDAPTGVTVAVGGASKATVSFTPPATASITGVTGYTVVSNPGSITASTTSSPVTISGLTEGTSYTFTVTPYNGAGAGSSATSSAFTAVGVPGAPTAVSATLSSGQATVYWIPPTLTDGIISYTVQTIPAGIEATVAAPATSATLTGLTNGLPYQFTVFATNVAGNGTLSSPSAAQTYTDPAVQSAVTTAGTNNSSLEAFVTQQTTTGGKTAQQMYIESRNVIKNNTNMSATQKDNAVKQLASATATVTQQSAMTIPSTQTDAFLESLETVAGDRAAIKTKPVVVVFPTTVGEIANVDLRGIAPKKQPVNQTVDVIHMEVPKTASTVVVTTDDSVNTLGFDSTTKTLSDGTSTYAAGSIIKIGAISYLIVGINSVTLLPLTSYSTTIVSQNNAIIVSQGIMFIMTQNAL